MKKYEIYFENIPDLNLLELQIAEIQGLAIIYDFSEWDSSDSILKVHFKTELTDENINLIKNICQVLPGKNNIYK